ncbi:MAG: hypothetical protein ACXV5P_08540 [Halobacteriota archaeon]
MKKSFLAGMLAAVMLTTVLAAGCVNPLTPSPSPRPSPATTTAGTTQNATQLNLSAYLTNTMQAKNYTVVTPFARYSNQQTGTVYYNCTIRNAHGTYHVSYQVMPTSQAAQARYAQVMQGYTNQGYRMMQQNATAWSGYSNAAAKNVGVSYVTSPLMRYSVVTVTQEKASTTQPAAQNTWMQTWNAMQSHASTVGSTLPATTRTQMQTEMQAHMTNRTTSATAKASSTSKAT